MPPTSPMPARSCNTIMRPRLIPFLVFFFTIASCNNNSKGKTQYSPRGSILLFDTASGKYSISSLDKKLISTWESFRQAISKSDFKTLTSLSFDSIICDDCLPMEENRVIPVDTFYKKYAKDLFSNSFVSILSDSSKIRCSYDYDSVHFHARPFLTTASDLRKPKVAQIFISYNVPPGELESSSGIMCFVETRGGYKFFEYSTIP